MPNIKSAMKRMRTSEKRRIANQAEKSRLRNARRSFRDAVSEGNLKNAETAYRTYASLLDKSAKHGIIQANTASRYKSRATAQIAKISA